MLGFDVVGVDVHRLDVVLLRGVAGADRLVPIAGLGFLELVVGFDLFVPQLKVKITMIQVELKGTVSRGGGLMASIMDSCSDVPSSILAGSQFKSVDCTKKRRNNFNRSFNIAINYWIHLG